MVVERAGGSSTKVKVRAVDLQHEIELPVSSIWVVSWGGT